MAETTLAEPLSTLNAIRDLPCSPRIVRLRSATLAETRYLSIEQARIITRVYRTCPDEPTPVKRALALAAALDEMPIRIDPDELIVGNRTPGVRSGVVFPEAGIAWLDREIESLPKRAQDRFEVRPEDVRIFRTEILPFWRGRTLEDEIYGELGDELEAIAKVVKINQKDHAQGHICPNVRRWLEVGPAGLLSAARSALSGARSGRAKLEFYHSVIIALEAAVRFIERYAVLAESLAASPARATDAEELRDIARICRKIASAPPETYHEAVQSLWFLFVILHMESNASSFSPGRADQYLYPYLHRELESGALDLAGALEITEALWLKFNQIVYLRNSNSAKYFAGFPIGFNIAIGGQTSEGRCAVNTLSHLMLQAQAHIGLPQPNLSARLFTGSSDAFVDECTRVIGLGSGMPQIFTDEAVIPALESIGIAHEDALDYAIVGCVELTSPGNTLGWSDAAMFNMVKALELSLNDGVCMLTGEQLGPRTGTLSDASSYGDVERRFRTQLDHFIDRMMPLCDRVDRVHAQRLPSPFLSSVVDDCLSKGTDVTAGGARYNLSGIQAIQVADIADSLAAIKRLVYDERRLTSEELLAALRRGLAGPGDEPLRQQLLHGAPKYGNDVAWVDEIGEHWVDYFASRMRGYVNARGGPVHTGLYTVSAHVPMGRNVGATPDGRRARAPLADGGLSAVYGRDEHGPTAVLRSVSRIDPRNCSNGGLLNLKFLPSVFETPSGRKAYAALLRTLVALRIVHAQFNVVRREDLIAAQEDPDRYRSLTIRVAGYTAFFTELAPDLQDEIIARTEHATV